MITGLPRFLRAGEPAPKVLVDAPAGRFLGLLAFTLGLKDIMGPGIGRARLEGWRCLMEAPAFPAVACVVTERRPGIRPRMTSLMRGRQIAQVLRGARQIESLDEVRAQDYSLQMLSVPGLLVEAFWLKSQGTGPDLVVPFYSVSKELKLKRAYPMDKFMSIARSMASKFLAFGF